MKTGILAQQSGKENPTNLLSNGNFEAWSAGAAAAPDGWSLSGGSAAVAREATIIKRGTYSVKLTRNGGDCQINQIFGGYEDDYWKGRQITFGCWVYATVANRARIGLVDSVGASYSSYHKGDSTWQWLSVTHTVNAAATFIYPNCNVITGDTSAYFDGAMCVEGESAFAFSDKPASEGMWVDYFATSTIVGWAAGKTGTIYTKKIGKTVFVQFSITGTSDNATTTFTVPYAKANDADLVSVYPSIDNGSAMVAAVFAFTKNQSTVTFYKDAAAGAFTASGTKNIRGQFFYEAA